MNTKLVMWIVAGAILAGAAFSLMTPATAAKKNITSDELVKLQDEGA